MSLLSFAWTQNEKEDVIAAMWRHVALNSKAPEDQLTAYQNAVEVLEVWLGIAIAITYALFNPSKQAELKKG